MKKKIITIFSLILLTIVLVIVYPYIKPLKINYNWSSPSLSSECEDTFSFISNKLSREDGAIFTNYLDLPSKGDETKGHDILSESEGLIMLYSLEINDKKLFDQHFNIIDKYMFLDNGLISWRISKDNNQNKTSALIDDLRIVKSLILAYDRFGEYRYRFAATKLSKAILNNSTSNGLPIDFNDSVNKSNSLTLCYIDLEAMNLLNIIHGKWAEITISSEKVLNNGLISQSIPFFKKSYDIKSNTYSNEKETELLYSLMCWENKLNNGEDITPIISWIKSNLTTYNGLFNKYDNTSGKPIDNIESTAIYAVASRLAYSSTDLDLYDKLSSRLSKFQIKDKESKLYGAFGFAPKEEVYSFDNLQGLLSLLRAPDRLKNQ